MTGTARKKTLMDLQTRKNLPVDMHHFCRGESVKEGG